MSEMSSTHISSYALRIGISVMEYGSEFLISCTFQRKHYISIARTGNVIMYALGHPNYITIHLCRYNAEVGKFKLLLLEQLLINWRIYKLHIKLNIIFFVCFITKYSKQQIKQCDNTKPLHFNCMY